MTVAELEAALTGAGLLLLGAAEENGFEGTFPKYRQKVGKIDGDVARAYWINYVTNPAGTVAYWLDRDPTLQTTDEAFRAWLEARVADDTFEGYQTEWVNPGNETAVVRVIEVSGQAVSEKRYFVDRDGAQAIRVREITAV